MEWDDAETDTENDDDEIQYKSDDDDEDDVDDDTDIDNEEDRDEDDEYRDPRRQRRRRGGARLSDADSHSLKVVGVGECTYGSSVRVPLTGVDSTSFMPTPRVDACIENPFLDLNQRHLRGRRSEYGILEHFWVIHAIQRKLDHEHAGKHATGSTIASVSSILYSTPYSTSCCSSYSTTYSGASCAGYIIAIWRAYIAVERPYFKGNQQLMSCARTPTCAGRRTIRAIRCAKIGEEHRKRWQEYRSSHSSTDDSSQSPPLSERDIWVQGNLTSKGRVYGFGAEGVVMKQRSRLSVSSRSSSVNNYDARKMEMRLNESAVKAAEEACQKEIQDLRK
ncbi:hypothetical protein Cgig2_021148 [Carnegiea gigantea]|uniref:Uncharacterized protein n=1 Tax=Carnegiea gigantea TaxID=171969 RepID=A0A9Q1QR67_9CARY|nr:hypothetical protein Cgig2_021148 [Carnegiea gigantea]